MAKYVVNGEWGAANPALMPAIPNTPVSTTWGWSHVHGAPGTQPVQAPKPGVHSISPNPLTQPSWCSPDMILPDLYQSTPDPAWRHVPVRPQEMMPVPAVNLFNGPGIAMRSRKTGGQYQVGQPSVTQSWPDLLGRMLGAGNSGSSLPPKGQ